MSLFEMEYKGFKIIIDQDEDPQNPRTEWDNATVMWCWHQRYDFGDKSNPWNFYKAQELAGGRVEELEQLVREELGKSLLAMAPLYLYDHSTQTLKIGNFSGMLPQGHAEFDTMWVGWIMVTKESYEKCCGAVPKRKTQKFKDQLSTLMQQDVTVYNMYLHGECYWWCTEDSEENMIDNCGGYYLSDNESYDSEDNEMISQAKASIDAEIESRAKAAKEESDDSLRAGQIKS